MCSKKIHLLCFNALNESNKMTFNLGFVKCLSTCRLIAARDNVLLINSRKESMLPTMSCSLKGIINVDIQRVQKCHGQYMYR